jgi:hypothetical protein
MTRSMLAAGWVMGRLRSGMPHRPATDRGRHPVPAPSHFGSPLTLR